MSFLSQRSFTLLLTLFSTASFLLSPCPFADALVLGPWPASSRVWQETKDTQWQRALAYLSAIPELNYMTQIVIMLYEDNTRVRS